MAHREPYIGPLPVVSRHCCLRPRSRYNFCIAPRVPCQRRVPRAAALVMVHPAPYCSLYRCPYYDTNATPSHDTIFITRHSPQWPSPRACPARPCTLAGHVAGPLGRVTGRVLDRIVAQSDRIVADHAHLLCSVSRYSLLYRDSKQQMGSSSAYCLQRFFFFTSFFFSFQLLENHQKNIYYYYYFHFPVEQNKFLKIYFILFYFF